MDNLFIEYLQIKEAAELIGVSTRTLRGLLKSGKIPFCKEVGRNCRIRVKRSDLVSYMDQITNK